MFIFIVFLLSLHAAAQPYRIPPDTLRFFSNTLKEERLVVLYIPENMALSDSADILVMLDGEYAGYRLGQLTLPEMEYPLIVAGIIHSDRRKELLPYFDGALFLDYLQNEVLIILEDMFFLKRKILFGHSFGGATVLYSLQHQCNLFDMYIASSPKPIRELTECNLYTACGNEGGKYVFLAYGSRDHRTVIRDCGRLEKNLEHCMLPGPDWEIRLLPGLKHDDTAVYTLESALKHFSRITMPPPGN